MEVENITIYLIAIMLFIRYNFIHISNRICDLKKYAILKKKKEA